MPSSRAAKRGFLKALPAESKKIYELGSGWGGVAFAIARARPNAQVFAFELSLVPWLFSYLVCRLFRYSNITLYRKNFLFHSLKEADTLICYLYPGGMQKLQTKCAHELPAGAWILSNTFTLPGWKPQTIIQLKDFWKSAIYVYQKPMI